MEDKKEKPARQGFSAIRGFYEKCTQTFENTHFLTSRFLHIFINLEKYV